MMFCDVVAKEAGLVGRRRQLQALFEDAIEWLVATLKMIEDAECDLTHSRLLNNSVT